MKLNDCSLLKRNGHCKYKCCWSMLKIRLYSCFFFFWNIFSVLVWFCFEDFAVEIIDNIYILVFGLFRYHHGWLELDYCVGKLSPIIFFHHTSIDQILTSYNNQFYCNSDFNNTDFSIIHIVFSKEQCRIWLNVEFKIKTKL